MIRQQLQRHDFENRREQIRRLRYLDDFIGNLADFGVAFRHDGDDLPFARFDFLNIGKRLLVEEFALPAGGIAGRQHDDRELLVDQRVRPVFHFARWITFGVDVGNLLELERAFEGDGEVDAAAEKQKIGGAE